MRSNKDPNSVSFCNNIVLGPVSEVTRLLAVKGYKFFLSLATSTLAM